MVSKAGITGQSRETYWRDKQVLKVNEKVGKKTNIGKKDKHRTVKGLKGDKLARQAGIEGKWTSRQEQTGKRVTLARQADSEGK